MDIRHVIDFNDITPEQWDALCALGSEIKASPADFERACEHKIMATLFYEPSTRTQLSFQTAMMRLGGKVMGFADPSSSSVSKGETLRDTVKIISAYSDVTVIRNPVEGAAYASSLYSRVPIINAGDGGHLHPTQTMTDMFTIQQNFGRYQGLTIGLCGDLLNGRTVHSLVRALSRYEGNTFYFISTNELKMPSYVTELLMKTNNTLYEVETLDECISKLDILYMTRIQRERFKSAEDYEKQSGIYVLTSEKMKQAKRDMIILHPLPKVDEIDYDVDDDPRARYFEQAENGMYIRMALIHEVCKSNSRIAMPGAYPAPEHAYCKNPRCISNHEKYLPPMTKESDGHRFCAYCDHMIKA